MTTFNSELFELSMTDKAKPLAGARVKPLEEMSPVGATSFEALNADQETC